jgi:DNA-binding MarR family transcriptional regulator
VPADEQAVNRIMAAQLQVQRLFADDRSHPLFRCRLTVPQLRILMLLELNDGGTGRRLAESTGVGLATMTGMIDRLAAQDLVARREDPRDRRVRRIELTPAGRRMIGDILSGGADRHRAVLSRLTAAELAVVEEAVRLVVAAATAELAERGDPPAAEEPDEG